MGFDKISIMKYDNKLISEKELDDLEACLVGNFGVINTYRYRSCCEIDGEVVLTDLLRINFDDGTEVCIFGQ